MHGCGFMGACACVKKWCMDVWVHGCMCVGAYACTLTSNTYTRKKVVHGCTSKGACACVGLWVHGCMDVWVHGCMVVWVHGCMFIHPTNLSFTISVILWHG